MRLFSDMQYLSDVLLPIKDAILFIEANCSTLANCYINLIKIATAIQNLPANEFKEFHNDCIKKFNNQFEEFNDSAYQLAYFLHPAYKGVRLKFGTFPLIASYARKLQKQMDKNKESCEALIMQLHWYKEQEQYINRVPNPYIALYTIAKPNCLQCLAIKLFSIIPNLAICEQIFSLLGWIYGSYQIHLDIDRLEGLAKVYQFNLLNPIDQLHHTQTTEVISKIITNITETVFKELEEETLADEENTELFNPTKDLYPNEPDLNLNVLNFIDLNSSVFTYSKNRYESQEINEIMSDNNDMQEREYNVGKIIAQQLDDNSH
ncbi:44938_t:CDS:2 [Gigaspora margarita]|uniref:44938_t:CDS:1 n=1 Tax=Gigaspora margarita TaxID=4874 RepID=A0ABN7WZH4_GIGMA|nr:44938_t:CDS:2 [Gigaspora margarita]